MGKVVFFVLIGVIVWVLFFARRSIGKKSDSDDRGRRGGWMGQSEPMRQCARCGVHIPVSEACEIASQRGKYSCADPENCSNRPH
jgi:hypothetical protein